MERISQDVALSIINTIRVKCINVITDENTPPGQIEAYNERDKLLAYEEQVVYGLEGDSNTKDIVLDKIERYYSPEVRSYYAKARS
jgi:hypothetical protein